MSVLQKSVSIEELTAEYFGLEVPAYQVVKNDGRKEPLSFQKIRDSFIRAGALNEDVSLKTLCRETFKNIFDGVSSRQIQDALILSASTFIERDPGYSRVAARLYLQKIYKEVLGKSYHERDKEVAAKQVFQENIRLGVREGLLDPRLLEFNLEKLAECLDFSRDAVFEYIGMETLYERYFLRWDDRVIETPQAFWMRTAMGLALLENDREYWANEFISSTAACISSAARRPSFTRG